MMRLKLSVILPVVFVFLPLVLRGEDISAQRKTVPVGEVVFAKTSIPKGAYARIETADRFSLSDKIYARAFFRENVGELRDGESGFVDLNIDGRFIKRLLFTNRDIPKWAGEAQIYINNTGQDDFEGKPFSNLDATEHQISITVGREFAVKGDSANDAKRVLTRILASGSCTLAPDN